MQLTKKTSHDFLYWHTLYLHSYISKSAIFRLFIRQQLVIYWMSVFFLEGNAKQMSWSCEEFGCSPWQLFRGRSRPLSGGNSITNVYSILISIYLTHWLLRIWFFFNIAAGIDAQNCPFSGWFVSTDDIAFAKITQGLTTTTGDIYYTQMTVCSIVNRRQIDPSWSFRRGIDAIVLSFFSKICLQR